MSVLRPTLSIPLVTLALVGGTALLALRRRDPLSFPQVEMPQDVRTPPRVLAMGTEEIVGRVLGADGTPLPDASISTLVRDRPTWTFTDALGFFRLAEVDAGPLELHVLEVDHRPQTFSVVADGESVMLRLEHRVQAPPTLEPIARADLAGTLAPAWEDGERAGYEVALLPTADPTEWGTGKPYRALTDEQGRFAFPSLERAEYRVLVLPPWARGGTWPDLLTGATGEPELYDHRAAGEPPLTLALGAISGRIEGTLMDRQRPVRGALIQVSPQPATAEDLPRTFPAVQSEADGHYLIPDLPPGRYLVRMTAGARTLERAVVVPARGSVDPGF